MLWRARLVLAKWLGFDIDEMRAKICTYRDNEKLLREKLNELKADQSNYASLLTEHERAQKTMRRCELQIATLELENARLRALPVPAAGSGAPFVPAATRLRDMLTALFEQYETTRGISCDAYCDTPQWHAMAEAQYLEAVVISHSTGLLSSSQAKQRAKASVARLQVGALHRVDGVFAQWGLGFRWQSFPSNEPFLVTTALVTRALIAAQGLADCLNMAREGLAGLTRLPYDEIMIDSRPIALPVYAPTLITHAMGLFSTAQARTRAVASVGRLRSGAMHREAANNAQLGPGFGWQDLSADAACLTTTALVVRALLAAEGLASGADLACEGLAGAGRLIRSALPEQPDLEVSVCRQDGIEPNPGKLALWAQSVMAGRERLQPDAATLNAASSVLAWLDGSFVSGLGWPSGATRPVFALRHQSWIVEALIAHSKTEIIHARAFAAFAAFSTGQGYSDSLTLAPNAVDEPAVEFPNGQTVVVRGEAARLGSLGALLGCFALLADKCGERGYWDRQIRCFPFHTLPDHFGVEFREEMHLARGLALALARLRADAPSSQTKAASHRTTGAMPIIYCREST